MKPIISSAQMREIDRQTSDSAGVPSLTLMENAANAVTQAVTEVLGGTVSDKTVLVFCGKGNNGGDGAAAARLLAIAGARVDIILLGSIAETKGDARTNFQRLQSPADSEVLNFFECVSDTGWQQLLKGVLTDPHEIVIDALFGTGPTRPVAGIHREAVRFMRAVRDVRDSSTKHAIVVSVDLPSGLDSDSGELIGEAVAADITVTMTAPKLANVLPPAASLNGRLIVADIGSPDELLAGTEPKLFLIDQDDAQRWLRATRYTPDSYKNKHGRALIIAGSRGFTGAAVLSGNAAMRAGAGLVTIATPLSAQPLVATQAMAEVMTAALAETDRGAVSEEAVDYVKHLAQKVDVIAIGPGLSADDERTRNFVRRIVAEREVPVVVDADGLNCLAPWPSNLRGSDSCPIILTPHPGEMVRLLGQTIVDRVETARRFAAENELILVLKGTHSLIATPDRRVFVNPSGNAGLGTAGAGDTLTGIITGFLAQAYGSLDDRASAIDATIAALFIGGLAGDLAARELGMRAMVASDIRERLPQAIRLLDPQGETPIGQVT